MNRLQAGDGAGIIHTITSCQGKAPTMRLKRPFRATRFIGTVIRTSRRRDWPSRFTIGQCHTAQIFRYMSMRFLRTTSHALTMYPFFHHGRGEGLCAARWLGADP